jgi:predicted O-linked N-acetylglucosamine transferase (SPINDLY family)
MTSDRDTHAETVYQQGYSLHQHGRLEEARGLYQQALHLDSEHFDALHCLGVIALQTNDPPQALEWIGKAIRINPTSAVAHNNLGNALAALARWEAAFASYDRAVALKPDYTEAHYDRGNVFFDLGRFEAAIASYGQAIAFKPGYALAYNNRGLAHWCLKDHSAAMADFDQVLEFEPDNAGAHNYRGHVLRDLRHFEEAVASYDRAIACKADYAEACNGRGTALAALQRAEAALASYEQAIRIFPAFAEAHHNRGTVCKQLGRWDEALAGYDRALAIKPDFAEAHSDRGDVLRALGRWEEALACCDQALALRPDFAEAHHNRGNISKGLAQWDAALASYDKALALNPDFAAAHSDRGDVLRILKRWDESLACCDRALALNPCFAEAYVTQGNVFSEFERWTHALGSYERALAIKGDLAEAHYGLGNVQRTLGQFADAAASLDRAAALNPDLKWLPGLSLYVKMRVCDWKGFDESVAALVLRIERGEPVSPPLPVLSLSDSAELQRRAAEIWVREECPPNAALPPMPTRARREKIRIGYFSADFRHHPVAALTAGLFETHDRSRFEITAFSFGPDTQDEMRMRLEKAFDRFIDVRRHSDRDIALLARDMELDIAVDLGGFTQDCRPNIFALRVAPLQVSYLGYLGTMAAPYIDYLVADATIVPPAHRRRYTEKILYVPSYQANDTQRLIADRSFTREALGLPPSGFVFCCFNASYKITPATFAAWMRILKRVPESVLFLYAPDATVERNLKTEALDRGVDPTRLVFGTTLPRADYVARYRAADLFLDTLPYNAGTTASDALWAGLPVLTCTGEAFASRVAASLLMAIEMPDLITDTPERYEKVAVELATDPLRLADIKQRLADHRLTTPLFDIRRFTQHLEAAYTRIYERHQAGLPPDHAECGPGALTSGSSEARH